MEIGRLTGKGVSYRPGPKSSDLLIGMASYGEEVMTSLRTTIRFRNA